MTTIRLAQQADAKNLAALAIQVWLHTYALNGISTLLSDYVFAEFTEEKFQQLIAAPDKCILVAEVDAHLVGYARLNFNAARSDVSHTSTELATLYVQEHFTRRQIGTALLAACAQQARRRCGKAALRQLGILADGESPEYTRNHLLQKSWLYPTRHFFL